MRHSVLRMALAMDEALGQNVNKGHWRNREAEKLMEALRKAQIRLDNEIRHWRADSARETLFEMHKKAILTEAVAVANYAMMVADQVGALKEPWHP